MITDLLFCEKTCFIALSQYITVGGSVLPLDTHKAQ